MELNTVKTNEEKKKLLEKHLPKSPVFLDGIKAFIFGGALCAVGQIIYIILLRLDFNDKDSSFIVTCIFILIAAILTGLGVFDRIARIFGAGTLVPVTGFSNSVTSQAIDAVGEGYILGVGSKIFNVAGPVILYGMLSGALYGIIYYSYNLIVSIIK